MVSTMKKTVQTLGERLAADSRRLTRRYRSSRAWLDRLTQVIERTSAIADAVARFERRDAAPRRPAPAAPAPLEPLPGKDKDEATLVWPAEAGGRPLAPTLRDALRPLIGPDIERARLHTGDAADALARSRRADAVTIGADMHFRAGAFAPDTPKGLGLLAHELTHVAESLAPGADWRRSTEAGVRAEEVLAYTRESGVSRSGAGQAVESWLPARSPLAVTARAPAPPSPRAATAHAPAAPSPQARPMLAETDRPLPSASPPLAAQPNLDQLRDSLYRDIMARIRVDFERGG
jgi:hypothetical protein